MPECARILNPIRRIRIESAPLARRRRIDTEAGQRDRQRLGDLEYLPVRVNQTALKR